MDGDSLERAGIAAAAAAQSTEAIDEVRVEYLGRKSELKQACARFATARRAWP